MQLQSHYPGPHMQAALLRPVLRSVQQLLCPDLHDSTTAAWAVLARASLHESCCAGTLCQQCPTSGPQIQVWRGCERSVITYSSLISACEKAGEWQLALDLFGEMHAECILPNTVTYNSLITACAQGELSRFMHDR